MTPHAGSVQSSHRSNVEDDEMCRFVVGSGKDIEDATLSSIRKPSAGRSYDELSDAQGRRYSYDGMHLNARAGAKVAGALGDVLTARGLCS